MNAIIFNSAQEELLRQLEEQSFKLAKNQLQLERFNYEMEQFAYIASHDLKSPLRNISSYAQLLKRRYYNQLDLDANEFIDYIVDYTQKMNRIVSELLEYSRADRDKNFVTTDCNRIVELIRNKMYQILKNNEVIMTYDQLPTILIQKAAFQQLLENIIDNAIVFRSEETPTIHISCKALDNKNDKWQFSIQDNGVGLDEIYHEKAFLPFQRINNRERPGSGMGLAICRKIVKMHGGDIWYKRNSEKDREPFHLSGTTFHFTVSQCFIEKIQLKES